MTLQDLGNWFRGVTSSKQTTQQPTFMQRVQQAIGNFNRPVTAPGIGYRPSPSQPIPNRISQAIVNSPVNPIAKTAYKIASPMVSFGTNKPLAPVPTLPEVPKPIANTPVVGGVAQLGRGLINFFPDTANQITNNIAGGALDLSRILASDISRTPLPAYNTIKSPLVRIAYNKMGYNAKPQEVLGNIGQAAFPFVAAQVPTNVKSSLNVLEKPTLGQAAVSGINAAGNFARFGLLQNLATEAKKSKSGQEAITKAVKAGAVSGALGFGIGFASPFIGYGIKKLFADNLDKSLMNGDYQGAQKMVDGLPDNNPAKQKLQIRLNQFIQSQTAPLQQTESIFGGGKDQKRINDLVDAFTFKDKNGQLQTDLQNPNNPIAKLNEKDFNQVMAEISRRNNPTAPISAPSSTEYGASIEPGVQEAQSTIPTGNIPGIKPSQSDLKDALASGNITAEEAQALGYKNQLSNDVAQATKQDVKNILRGSGMSEKSIVTRMKASERYPEQLRQMINGDYVQVTNEQTKKDAIALINKDETLAMARAMNPQNVVDQAIGIQLFNHLMDTGRADEANAVLDSISGTNQGQMIQILSTIDRGTPAGAVKFAQNLFKAYNKQNPTSPLELSNETISSIYDKANTIQNMAEGRDKNIAINELLNQINDMIPSSIGDKMVTLWKAGLLSSLRTHERNFIGNTIMQGSEIAKDVPASWADQLMSLKTGQRSMTFTTQGLGQGAVTGAQSAKDIITLGYDPEQSISKYDIRHVTWGDNPIEQALKKVTDGIFRTLGAEDKPFWNAAYARSLYDQAGTEAINSGQQGNASFINSLVKDPTTEMKAIAIGDANVATFHDVSKLGEVAQAVQKFSIKGIPVGQIIAPFTGVPTSIAGKMVAYSPVGLINGITQATKVMATNIPDSLVPQLQRQAAQDLGRGVIGSAIFLLGAYLAKKGLITGQPVGTSQTRQWELENKPRNSVFIFGKWRQIGSIGPQNLILLAGAKAQEALNSGKDLITTAQNLGAQVGQDFMGQTFLQGVQGPLNAITDPQAKMKQYLGQLISSPVPNILKDVSKSIDPYQRETNTVMDYLQNSIPVWRNQGLIRRDVLGNPIPQEPTGWRAFIDLFNSKTPKINDPVINELSRLDSVNQNATPSKLTENQTIAGQKLNLTPQQLNVLNATIGPQLHDAIAQLINTPAYQNLPDEEKNNAIGSVVTSIRKIIRGKTDINSLSSVSPNNPIATIAPSTTSDKITIVNPDTGNVRLIDKNWTPPELKLTGQSELDKKVISDYKSQITQRAKDIYSLYSSGNISAQDAEKQLEQLSNYVSGTSSAKKPAKVTIRRVSLPRGYSTSLRTRVSNIRVKALPKIKLAKAPTLKAIKQTKLKIAKLNLNPTTLKSNIKIKAS